MVDATGYKAVKHRDNTLTISADKTRRETLKTASTGSMEAVAAKSPMYNAIAQRGLAVPDPALVGAPNNAVVISEPVAGSVGTVWQHPGGEDALFKELAEKGKVTLKPAFFSGVSLPDEDTDSD